MYLANSFMNSIPNLDSVIVGIGVIVILCVFYWTINRNKRLNKWLNEWDAQHKEK